MILLLLLVSVVFSVTITNLLASIQGDIKKLNEYTFTSSMFKLLIISSKISVFLPFFFSFAFLFWGKASWGSNSMLQASHMLASHSNTEQQSKALLSIFLIIPRILL